MSKVNMMSAKDKKKGSLVPHLRFPEFRDAGEWAKIQLSKIAIPVSERATDGDADAVLTLSAEHGVVTQGAYFGKKVAGDDVRRYIRIKNNDFVYNDRTTKIYKYGTIKRLSRHAYGIVSPIYKCFRFNDEEIPVFWEWYFESGEHDAQLYSIINEGAKEGRFNIAIRQFLSTHVYFPNKIEQQKIADCLSSLDERIAAEANKLDALKAHKSGLLKQLFPAEGETLPALRFPEFRSAGEWEERTLSQLGELVSGLTYSPDDVRDNGLLVLRSSNVQNGMIVLDDNVYVRHEIGSANPSEPNDILICVRNGSKSLIGKNALIPEGMPPCTHGAFMMVFRSRSAKFVIQLFQTETYESQVSAGLGATINSINGNQLKKYKFFVPKPAEQQKIADCLSSLDELIAAQRQKLSLLKTHKKGLMQQLFPVFDEAKA